MLEEKSSYNFPRSTKASGTLLLEAHVVLSLGRDEICNTLYPKIGQPWLVNIINYK